MKQCIICNERPAQQRRLCDRCYQRERYNGRLDHYPPVGRQYDTKSVIVTVEISHADLTRLWRQGNRQLYEKLRVAVRRAEQARALLRGNTFQNVKEHGPNRLDDAESIVEKRLTIS